MATPRPKERKPRDERLTEYPLTARVPADLNARLESLVPILGTKSVVMRLALLEGVRVLERRHRDR